MSMPPDDPFYNSQTENSPWPAQWPRPGQNYPQQGSAPNYPPPQGPGMEPGFTQLNAPQPGSAPNYPGQPPAQRQGGIPPTPPQQPFPPAAPFPGQPSQPPFPGQPPQQPFPLNNVALAPSPGQPPQQPFPPTPPHPEQRQAFPASGRYNEPQPPQGQYSPPPMWQKPAPRKSNRGPIIIGMVLVLILIGGGAGVFALTHGKKGATPQVSATSTASGQSTPGRGSTPIPTPTRDVTNPLSGNTATIGQPVQAGGWIATLIGVKKTTSSDIPPPAGLAYLEISLRLKNTQATPELVSSVVQFSLIDANGKTYDETKGLGDTNIKHPIDGSVAPGQTDNGQIAYQVPQSMHDFTLNFKYDLLNGNSTSISWVFQV